MTQKNETPVTSKPLTETKATSAKPVKTPVTQQFEQTSEPSSSRRGSTGDLSPELVELVAELRDTVKRLDPRKHTTKTLRRSLSNVRDILKDIEELEHES
jgi:hypothetical protein